jgi:Uma2 family endonuclease
VWKCLPSLQTWNDRTQLGQTIFAPGLIFADDDDVIPDVAWLSNQRLAEALGSDGKLHSAPDLIIEVLSPGAKNERRDREAKMGLYSRRSVREYWILDWRLQSIEVFRSKNDELAPVAVLVKGDKLESPLLPGLSVAFDELFIGADAG